MTNPTDNEELTLAKLAQEYSDDDLARELMGDLIWPKGPVCPHCGCKTVYRLTPQRKSKAPCRLGVLKCKECRKQFSVTVGTIFEKSKVPLSKWVMATFILCASKKGVSAHQLHRMIGVTYKTAWFMFHRLRHAMTEGLQAKTLKGVVEIDDAYVGGTPPKGQGTAGRGTKHKTPIVALVERGGDVRVKVVAGVSHKNLREFVDNNVDKTATVNSDQWKTYPALFKEQAQHDTVNHSAGEFSRHNADGTVSHVNTCESFFSLLKRGVYGSFHHISKEHLPRYCDEFAFRWNHRKKTDGERMAALMQQVTGKRLTYRATVQ